MKYVTCTKCGWIHFEISREHAEEKVKKFNECYETLTDEEKDLYGGLASKVYDYEHCQLCGESYKHFRLTKEGELPLGATIGPIISRED